MICSVNTTQSLIIDLEHLPKEIIESYQSKQVANSSTLAPLDVVSIQAAEVNAITNAIMRCDKNVALSADLLGIGKSTLYRKLKRNNLTHLIK
ncbi:helix-turn-helix domain-containing protein [Desulfosporosinus fructosivorans]